MAIKTGPNGEGGSAAKKFKSSADLIPGTQLKDNSGQGNCLFHALSDCLQFCGQECHHLHLRASCVKHLRKHSSTYSAFWDGSGCAEGSKPNNFSEYVNEVAKEGSWCGYFELAAMAVTMNRPIVIAHAAGNFHCFNSEGSLEPIALFYNGKDHYQAYVGEVPPDILALTTKPVASGNRGGIPSSVCGHTVRNASCCASSIGGRTKQCRSLSKASPAVGRTPKRSPSTAVAMSNFVNASGARCSRAETLLLKKRFASTMKLNKKNADARKREKNQRSLA